MSLPAIAKDEYSTPFFENARRGQLVMPRCENGHFQPTTQGFGGPVARCHECRSALLEWHPVSGDATLVSWTVLHLRNQEPPTRIVGIVELSEGPWLKGCIDCIDDRALSVGLPIRVEFIPTGEVGEDGEPIPAFVPVSS